jgi:CBS domain-containing protein
MILREVLHAHIPTLRAESTLRDAVDKIDIYQFPGLVVVDDMLAPIGVITEGDICRAAAQQGGLMSLGHAPVERFMTRSPKTAGPDLEVSDALQAMLSQGLTLLPVVEADRVIGVALRCDLMQAMLMDLTPPPTAGAEA